MFLRSLASQNCPRTVAGLLSLVVIAGAALAQNEPAASHSDVLIKNAVVMTATHGNIPNGSV